MKILITHLVSMRTLQIVRTYIHATATDNKYLIYQTKMAGGENKNRS